MSVQAQEERCVPNRLFDGHLWSTKHTTTYKPTPEDYKALTRQLTASCCYSPMCRLITGQSMRSGRAGVGGGAKLLTRNND
eukprot:4136071-Amphidinium_carterae.1